MATADLLSTDLAGWAPGTRHYRCSDGRFLAVEASDVPAEAETKVLTLGDSPESDAILVLLGKTSAALNIVARPTVVFLCGPNGEPVDADENDYDPLTPLARFPAGTTYEQALAELGY